MAATAAVAVLLAAAPAGAAVSIAPVDVDAGTAATIGFTVTFGWGMWPTTDLRITAPASVTGLDAVDKPGWIATPTGSSVEFSGGLLVAQTSDTLQVTFTVPDQPGTILTFPVEQTCVDGEQVQWNGTAADTARSAHMVPSVAVRAPARASSSPPTSAPHTSSSMIHPLLFFPLLLALAAGGWWFTRASPRTPR
jgi:uncharacterized protein YcnI